MGWNPIFKSPSTHLHFYTAKIYPAYTAKATLRFIDRLRLARAGQRKMRTVPGLITSSSTAVPVTRIDMTASSVAPAVFNVQATGRANEGAERSV